ncbi:MAG: tetratricopeptide repeat protein [Bacteroidetes bacterium]|nr:tetratricopeptide repeat protein [Bacteroidota bacterium]
MTRIVRTGSLFLLFLIPFAFQGLAQQQGKKDLKSLLVRLATYQKEDTVKIGLYRDIAFLSYSTNPKTGIDYGEKGIALAEKLNYRKGLIFCLISTGVCYWSTSNYPKALEILLKALKISEEDGNKTGIAKASANIGSVYADEANYPKALEYYFKALKISEELNDKTGIARKLGNIGTVYKEMNPPDYPQALEYFSRALKYYEETGEKRGVAVTLENISWVYSGQSLYKKAIDGLNKALPIVEETGEPRWIMYYYGTIGEAYYNMATDTSVKYRKTLNSLSQGEKSSFLNQSLGYLFKAAETAKEIKADKQLISWYTDIRDAYKSLGNWESAYRYSILSNNLKDDLFTQEKNLKIANLEAIRETQVKQKEIELQTERLARTRIQLIAVAGAFLGLIIIVLLVYLSRRKSERLLRIMLPAKIARRLKKKEKPIADMFENAAVVFADIVDFTGFSKDKDPHQVIEVLTDIFGRMDALSDKFGLEKIKTIGDCYMAVSGLPVPSHDSVENAANFAIACRELMREYKTRDGESIGIRIGMDAGQVIAGVIGEKRFSYDLWGDIVNTASRMESLGVVGEVQITENVVKRLQGKYITKERGEQVVKGKGTMKTWLLVSIVMQL